MAMRELRLITCGCRSEGVLRQALNGQTFAPQGWSRDVAAEGEGG
jgi:hypothetical protein